MTVVLERTEPRLHKCSYTPRCGVEMYAGESYAVIAVDTNTRELVRIRTLELKHRRTDTRVTVERNLKTLVGTEDPWWDGDQDRALKALEGVLEGLKP